MATSKKHSSAAAKTKPSSVSRKDKVCNGQDYGEDLVGSKIRVWWPLDNQFYNGVVDAFNSYRNKHRVLYEDGEKEILDMKKERWEFIEEDDDASADEISQQDESGDESSGGTPEPVSRKSARSNGKVGDVGGKIVAAASRMRSSKKISEATNRRQKRASSSTSDKVTKPRKNKRNRSEDKDGVDEEDSSDEDSKPLRSFLKKSPEEIEVMMDKLKAKKEKRKEEEAPKKEEGEKKVLE